MLVFQGKSGASNLGQIRCIFCYRFLFAPSLCLIHSAGISSSPAGLSDHLHSESIKKHRRLDLVERSVLIFPHIVENGARGPADELETPAKFVQVAWISHTSS
jgi:hypothetical protein